MPRTIELTFDNRAEGFILPINPKSVEPSEASLNQKLTLLNKGEINLLGNRGLIMFPLSSFFPSSKSPHFKRADRTPIEYISLLRKWKRSQKPIRVIIPDLDINLAMGIEKLLYSSLEGDADVYYTIDLAEYQFLNVPTVKVKAIVKPNGLKERPNTKVAPKTHTVKAGDRLWNIAQKYYGNGAKYTAIYSANQAMLDARNQKYKMPKNTIYAGQELVIP